MRAGLIELDAENQEAWAVFQAVLTRFTVDTHTVGLALAPVLDARAPEARADLLARLALLYDALYPPPKAKD